MKPTRQDVDHEEGPRATTPIPVRMADEGNIPGRSSAKALAWMLVALLVGLSVLYFAR
jgi:hypothetical protein